MGGAYVFPGGRVDDADRLGLDMMLDGTQPSATRMADVPRDEAIAHYVAAVREVFEETGVILARKNGCLIDDARTVAVHRPALLAGNTAFVDLVSGEGLRLALDELIYFAHWVTPEIEIKRFDTRFFIARAPAGQTAVHDETETVHSEWLDPADAIARALDGDIALPPPTWTTLSELSRFASIDDALDWARRKPVPRVQPRFSRNGEETLVIYPGDPLYPAIEGFVPPGHTRFLLENRRWRPVKPALKQD